MVDFEKDRRMEIETYAIINFLEIFVCAKLCDLKTEDYNSSACLFSLICDQDKIMRLISDCKNKNIDIFSNTIDDLFYRVKQNIDKMNDVDFSKSKLFEINNQKFLNIQNVYFSDKYQIFQKESNLTAVSELYLLPLSDKLLNNLLELTPPVEKIKRR